MSAPPPRLTPVAVVRLLEADDADLLEHVVEGVFDARVRREWVGAFLSDPSHRIAVALEDGLVVGMATAVRYVHPDKPPELWINELGVAPGFRSRGIGGRLLDALLDEARASGCREAWVLADPDNAAAAALYEGRGGRRSDAAMYGWPLSQE